MQISKTCSEDACTGIAKAKGLCLRCYGRAYYEIQRLEKAAERASVCARTACENVLYRFGLSGSSEYCSTRCRDVARRRAGFSPSPACCFEPCANLLDMGGWLLDPELGRKISYCSPKCQNREARRLEKLRTPARTCEIEGCEKRHVAKGLCKSHWNARNREINGREPSTWNDAGRDAYHRRRARQRDTKTGSPVRREAIGFRDGWICQICLESVDPALAYPDPRSPSLEHVVPLSRGGAHDPSNVVIAHLRCNLAKGARTLPVSNLTG